MWGVFPVHRVHSDENDGLPSFFFFFFFLKRKKERKKEGDWEGVCTG
jgi:hypothetical protein